MFIEQGELIVDQQIVLFEMKECVLWLGLAIL